MTLISQLWPAIEETARAAGVLRIGASPLEDRHVTAFAGWLERGFAASMHYLEKNLAVRREPTVRFPWAKSVIAITVPYSPERPQAPRGSLSNHIARYALGDDYHDVLDRVLRALEETIQTAAPGEKTWRYVDTGPLSDRSLAAQAGLGWIGRNGMLIDTEHGSWFFIGLLVTSLELDLVPDEVADRCGQCTRCVDACPTDAIIDYAVVDANRCISYATIEHRGDLPSQIASRLTGNVFGCDICQEVCPWNHAPAESHGAFTARDEYRATPVTDLLKMQQSDFSTLFRKSAIKRAKLAGMQRNVEAIGVKPQE